MTNTHFYELNVRWTGNLGDGTGSYSGYSRDHEVIADGRPVLAGSSDPHFRGDPTRWNPEQLLVASIAQCHLLWYLHLAARAGIVVTAYVDRASGEMVEDPTGAGAFSGVTLRPQVTITDASKTTQARALHAEVDAVCFISRSVNFPIRHEPTISVTASRS